MKNSILTLTAALALAFGTGSAVAQPATNKTEKTVTYISAETSADGGTEIAREKLLDCIQSLPNPERLQAQVSSLPVYMRGINGDEGRNEWVKSYTARMDITYLTKEKELIIVTTRAVNSQPPVMREVEKVIRHTENFVSSPSDGELYAGNSDRQYHFTTAKAAVKDVRERARVWISQQEATVCPAGAK